VLIVSKERYNSIIDSVNLDRLKGSTLFVTGGTGFFGIWLLNLVQLLNERSYSIKVSLLTRSKAAFLQKYPHFSSLSWIEWVEGDVESYRYPETKFDLFIHGAANTAPVGLEHQYDVFRSIVWGTEHTMKHAIAAGARRVLLISSGAVYGEVPYEFNSIDEGTSTAPATNQPLNAYGEAKRAAEMLAYCMMNANGIDIVTARCFAFAGYGIGEHLVLNHLIKQAKSDAEIALRGSGKAKRSFMHGEDLAVWLLKLLVDGVSGEIYNVGSDESYTIYDLACFIRDRLASSKKVVITGALKQEQRLNYIPSVKKARELGLDIWTTLAEIVDA
jgi:nucleoside-diphosphate-sugar epimerase